MKKLFIAAMVLFCTSLCCHAQYDEAATRKFREYMVMDGENPDHLRAQQQSLNRLTFGLPAPDEKGEGIYELRDSCIWLVESIYGKDRPVARLVYDEGTDIIVFARVETADCSIAEGENAELIGALNTSSGDIYVGANESEPFAMLAISGEIAANNGKALLRIDKADKRLVVLYLLERYLPQYAPEMILPNQ